MSHVYFNAGGIESRYGRLKISRMCLRRRAKRAQRVSVGMQELLLGIDRCLYQCGQIRIPRPDRIPVFGFDERPVLGSAGNSVRWFVPGERRRIGGTAFGPGARRVALSREVDPHGSPSIRCVSE